MRTCVTAVLDWAEDPLQPTDRVMVHPRSEVMQALADRPERGAGLAILQLVGHRWAVTSSSEPGTWHCVAAVEHGEMVGARCSCQAGQFAGRRTVGCSHAAAVLRRVVEVEVESVGMTA